MSHNFSPIQNHILSKLKNADFLRYRDMSPDGTPNDLYNYHLQFLVKKGFVDHSDNGYTLSAVGKKHVADPYTSDDVLMSLFKVNVIAIVSRINNGELEILNQVRKSHPSYGKVGAVGGVVRKGELVPQAAMRKLKQETGLTADFTLVGTQRRILYAKGEFFSDIVFPICYTHTSSGELIEESDFGENKWVPIDEAIENDSGDYDSIPAIVKVLEAVRDDTINKLPFFFEEVIQSDTELG